MSILAIDPSLTSTGWAAQNSLMEGTHALLGRIRPKDERGMQRINTISTVIENLLDDHDPQLVVYEGYAMGVRGGGRVFDIGELGGVLKFMFWRRNIRLLVVPPSNLKLFVTGKGQYKNSKLGKEAVMREASRSLGRLITSSDEADAYGLLQMGRAFCDRRLLPRDRRHYKHRALAGCQEVLWQIPRSVDCKRLQRYVEFSTSKVKLAAVKAK